MVHRGHSNSTHRSSFPSFPFLEAGWLHSGSLRVVAKLSARTLKKANGRGPPQCFVWGEGGGGEAGGRWGGGGVYGPTSVILMCVFGLKSTLTLGGDFCGVVGPVRCCPGDCIAARCPLPASKTLTQPGRPFPQCSCLAMCHGAVRFNPEQQISCAD